MIDLLVALPIAIPVTIVALCLVFWRSRRTQRVIALLGLGLVLAVAVCLVVAVTYGGPIELAIGGWRAPVGITFRADLLGVMMTLVVAVVGVAVGIYATVDPPEYEDRGFWPLVMVLVMSVCGAFLTADLFNLFVWFELMLIASFVLLALGGRREQLAGAHVYVVLNLIGSTIFLISVGLVYGAVHTLDLGGISARMAVLADTQPGFVLAIHALLLVAFGIKAAVFPLLFWLPVSYHTPLPSISALFAALLTKVGVYAMFRVTGGILPGDRAIQTALMIVAIATMLIGVAGALAQRSLRRILSFHIVSQIGYMVAGLALAFGTAQQRRFALAAGIFYVIHHILVKTNLFLVAGVIRRSRGTESLGALGGVVRTQPYLAVLFLISALSLAGVPPLSGFWAKLGILQAGFGHHAIVLVVVALATGLLTLLSMLKIWFGAFAGEPPAIEVAPLTSREVIARYAGATLLAATTIAISVAPEPLFALALTAVDQLRDLPRPTVGGLP